MEVAAMLVAQAAIVASLVKLLWPIYKETAEYPMLCTGKKGRGK